MKNQKFCTFFLFLCFFSICIFAEEKSQAIKFFFKYKTGDSYRILSSVNEDVFVNGKFDHNAKIANRISVRVKNAENGSAVHEAIFMTSENSMAESGMVFSYGQEYKSVFSRDAFGKYSISDEYFMPVVRDVPIFPDKEIQVGEKWNATGHEAHDLRKTFGMRTPYKIPFSAQYEYVGTVKENEKIFHKFEVRYELSYAMEKALDVGIMAPAETRGYSHQTIFWDLEKGFIDHYFEQFKITIRTFGGHVFVFDGTANAKVQNFERTSDKKTISNVAKKILDLGIKDVSVSAGEKGLTISIENIQFKADSDILLESEKIKLEKICEILNAYPENDLLVTGHTAARGTQKECEILSERRAQAVADYLVKIKARGKDQVFVRGMGAKQPIADNATELGREKNRRVEITIMDE